MIDIKTLLQALKVARLLRTNIHFVRVFILNVYNWPNVMVEFSNFFITIAQPTARQFKMSKTETFLFSD